MNVVPYQSRTFVADWLHDPAEIAARVGDTEFVPKTLRGNLAAITAAILYGDEVGLGPMQSLAKVHVVDGRPALAAEAQRALILQAGHDLWVEESTTTKCTVGGRRRDSDQASRVTWTMDDAKRANLAGKPNWRLYPRAMLQARATAELARLIFADAIGGLAAVEELEDDPAALNGAPAPELEAAPKATRKRKRAAVAVAPAPEEPPPPADEPAPEPEPEAEVQPLEETTRRRMMAAYRERGFTTSEQRHAFASMMLHRPIESSVDLSQDEASQLITLLETMAPAEP